MLFQQMISERSFALWGPKSTLRDSEILTSVGEGLVLPLWTGWVLPDFVAAKPLDMVSPSSRIVCCRATVGGSDGCRYPNCDAAAHEGSHKHLALFPVHTDGEHFFEITYRAPS